MVKRIDEKIGKVKMGKVVVITNRKGGVGKTMTTVSLGASLARQGKRVLVIDADSQHNLTFSLGVAEPDKLGVSLATIMSKIIAKNAYDEEITIDTINHAAGIIRHVEGARFDSRVGLRVDVDDSEVGLDGLGSGFSLDLMPANNSLAGMEIVLVQQQFGRETILRQYIDMVKPNYDYVLIDTAPTLDLVAINALTAADSVIIPVAPKFLDAKGLELLLRSIALVRRHMNPYLAIEGILFTMTDSRTKLTKEITAMIEEAYGEHIDIFTQPIPHSVRAAEASATGKSIFEHDPNGKVAAAYAALTQELLSKGGV